MHWYAQLQVLNVSSSMPFCSILASGYCACLLQGMLRHFEPNMELEHQREAADEATRLGTRIAQAQVRCHVNLKSDKK